MDLGNELSIRSLIERLQKLGESSRLRDQLDAIRVNSVLDGRLNELSDRQIGQLLYDVCLPKYSHHSPELTLVIQATDRLRRSKEGEVTEEEAKERLKQPVCPKCGDEWYLHYGIDEPDFRLCLDLACRHKEYINEQG